MNKVKKRKNQRERIKCEVDGCQEEVAFNLYEIPGPPEPKKWLNVCDEHERIIAFNNLKRQGFDPVTGYKLVFSVKGDKNGKPSTS